MNKTGQQQQGSQAGHLSPVVLFYTHTQPLWFGFMFQRIQKYK